MSADHPIKIVVLFLVSGDVIFSEVDAPDAEILS